MGRRIASLAVVSLLVLGIPGLDAQTAQAAEPTPPATYISGTVSELESGQYPTSTSGLTVRPWYLLGIPLRFGMVSGTIRAEGYKTEIQVSCLFGIAWNIRVADVPGRSVQFDCLGLWQSWLFRPDREPQFPYVMTMTIVATEGGDGVGHLGWFLPGETPVPQARADVQVNF